MKTVSISESGLPVQIWNNAQQLDNIPVINTETLVPAGARAVVIAPHPGDEVAVEGSGLLSLAVWTHWVPMAVWKRCESHPA